MSARDLIEALSPKALALARTAAGRNLLASLGCKLEGDRIIDRAAKEYLKDGKWYPRLKEYADYQLNPDLAFIQRELSKHGFQVTAMDAVESGPTRIYTLTLSKSLSDDEAQQVRDILYAAIGRQNIRVQAWVNYVRIERGPRLRESVALKPAIKAPSGMLYTAPKGDPQMHFFAYLAAADAGEFVGLGVASASDLIRVADVSDDAEAALMDTLRSGTLDGFVDPQGRFYDRGAAAGLIGQEGELDSMDLSRDPIGESVLLRQAQLFEAKRSPDMKTLKKHKVKLTDEERDQVMKAGAVWHQGPGGGESPGVWKSVVNGKVWYVCNTHRTMAAKPTLRGAIAAFDFIQSTS